MSETPRFRLSPGDLLLLAAALVLLGAFMALPWLKLEDGSTATGYHLVRDDLDLPAKITNTFLIMVPLAAGAAALVGLWGLFAPRYDRHLPALGLALGLLVLGYYYGVFGYEDHIRKGDALSFAQSGFYVGLAAALGLVVQYLIARPDVPRRPALVAFHRPAWSRPAAVWRWPFVVLRAALNLIGAAFGWLFRQIGSWMVRTPVLAYLVGLVAATELEQHDGTLFAKILGFRRVPSLFGTTELLEPFSKLDFSGILAPFFPSPTGKVDQPLSASWEAIKTLVDTFIKAFSTQGSRDPGFFRVLLQVTEYDIIIFVIPILIVALLLRALSNRVLLRLPLWGGITLQILLLYAAVSRWGALSEYRELILMYMGINIMLAASLNLVNGYMGEFSVGHAGFMAVGAYVASVLTMWLFTDEKVFGDAVLNPSLGLPFGFIIALIAGGAAAALAGLLVAFPSFRTRGDYLAIVTLAVNFIVTGVINNISAIGGPRGLNGVPLWTNVRWVFVVTVLSLIAIYNLVNSTFGKGIIAVREDEIAAGLMGVPTRRVKLVAFLVSSFIAGMAGGLFAHALAYVNPGNFGILKSTEALVMVYLGGMGSISGSVIAAVLFTILIEAFRPLAVLKWVVIPLILILLMLYRPQGLYGFREINLNLRGIRDDAGLPPAKEVSDDAAGD